MLKQAISNPAGGSSDIRTDCPMNIQEIKSLESPEQLFPAAGYELGLFLR